MSAVLHVARRQPVLHLRRIRSAGGEPLAILENYLPTDLLPVGESDLRSVGLYQAMRAAGVRMKVARQRIGAREGRTEECRLLDEPATSPLLTMDRITQYDTGVPVEMGPACLPARPVHVQHHPHRALIRDLGRAHHQL